MINLVVGILFIVCVIGLIFFKTYIKQKNPIVQNFGEDYDLKSIDINDIDRMADGSEFEMYLYRLLLELGYSGVYKTTNSRDFGADVVFTDRDGVRDVIQAKYCIENPALC